jgi:cell division protein FtsQ
MARKSSSTIPDEELEAASGPSASSRAQSARWTEPSAPRSRLEEESPLDARMLDLDDEAESPFLRGQKRVPVRRGALPLPRNAAGRVKAVLFLMLVAAGAAGVWIALERYGTQSWRFRLDSSDNITISGNTNVSRSQVLDVMASDLDRNVFFVPLEQRQQQLERIPWIKSASVMRLLPNKLEILITERTPVAFVEDNSHIQLVDADGVIMDLPKHETTKYSFPVILGISDSEPLSMRAARMKIYTQFIKELDSGGAHYSAGVSDVDLSDPDDLKATVTDPKGAVLVHLGTSNFLDHFKTYVAHVEEWRTQFQHLESVDLRYANQVIVNPDSAAAQAKMEAANAAAASEPTPGQTQALSGAPENPKPAVKKSRKHK